MMSNRWLKRFVRRQEQEAEKEAEERRVKLADTAANVMLKANIERGQKVIEEIKRRRGSNG